MDIITTINFQSSIGAGLLALQLGFYLKGVAYINACTSSVPKYGESAGVLAFSKGYLNLGWALSRSSLDFFSNAIMLVHSFV